MKTHRLAARALIVLSVAAAYPAFADATKQAEVTRHLVAQPGFLDVWRDADKGRVLLTIGALEQPLLMMTSLPYGLGSNDVGLDRGQGSDVRMVHFEKRGNKLFLVHRNTRFVANSSNPDERVSAVEAFASGVLWSGEILASAGGRHTVDISSFLLSDLHGVGQRLADTKQGAYRVDAARSAVLAEQAKSFPDNTELEAILTFAGSGEGKWVRDVAADPTALTLRQHVSFVRLPPAGFRPRTYHPASGGIDIGYYDFSTPLASSIDVRWQTRFRLEKTDPTAAVSTVKKPIVFYVDRGAPEPVRTALLEGARWWAPAFEKAGFKDAYRVELLPEGVDPMDIRYNVISWVHRATRGWSYGLPVIDPRTGEIIKGAVTLGSQRVRQDILIAESLLAPYGKGDRAKAGMAEQMALARLRQLSAHEVGHTLGFQHNFAASRHGNGSVMDYPHPLVKLDGKGGITLQDAYGVGVGPWDDFLVAHAYMEADEAGLAKLRADTRKAGMAYVADPDARSNGSSHAEGLLWDFGPDTLATYDHLMKVRRTALDRFSFDVLPPARQAGEIEARLVPVYLLHRYQLEAVARLLGGSRYASTTAGDIQSGLEQGGAAPVDALKQREALKRLSASLQAETLALPKNVLDIMQPAAMGFERSREYFASQMNTSFDPYGAAQAAAAHTVQFLLDPARLNRMAWQHARDKSQPGVTELLDAAIGATWKRGAIPASVHAGSAVQDSANWVLLDALLRTLDGNALQPAVQTEVRYAVRSLGTWLKANAKGADARQREEAADLVRRYLADPANVKLRPLPPIPPGAPI
jgi:hypothetical protein